MPGAETVKLQVELVEKNAEARLKALDKLAKEMGNRKITLNFDEASLARWKTATDGMTSAQLSAYAKLVTASENASAKIVAAGQRTAQEEMKQNAKLVVDRQKSFDKKVELYEKEDTKRRQIAAKTAQTEINANAKVQAAAIKGTKATKQQTSAQKELNTEAQKTEGIFDSITQRFTAANLISALITTGISKLRQVLREANEELKEMDKELTTIRIVTGASDSEISALTSQAFTGAKANGRNVNDYLTAAERFTRAGYRENIDQLSKLSLMTQNIGGVEEDTAAKFLLAADAAWKLNGNYESLMQVLDGVSSVADQNATDLGKIAEGITVAGSAFANAGESAQTFTAMLGVTTASTQRSGSEMARGLRTILFRVRQVKAEFDDGEIIDAKAISNAAKALEDVGISVVDDTGDLKSMSQILTELSGKWGKLSKAQQSYLQNYLAGNRNGNVLFALMDNWGKYEEMLAQYEDSAGTAIKKNEEYTKSWAAETEKLKTNWTELMGTITNNGEFQKGTVGFFATMLGGFNDYLQRQRQRRTDQIDRQTEHIANFWGIDLPDGDVAERIKAVTDALKDNKSTLVDHSEDAKTDADAVKEVANAFAAAEERIKAVSTAMKSERDSAVKSAADIFKAMTEAEGKGYYGSNAYREGASFFFGTSDRSKINQRDKDALSAYFDAMASGDYSNSAANFFKTITDGTNQIKAANGEVLASVTDIGDAYQWTFDKGNRGIDEYLMSLENNTGISKDFWASMIESLGMYSEEIGDWTDKNGEIKTEAEFDTDAATSALKEYTALLDSIPKIIQTRVITVYESSGIGAAKTTAAVLSSPSGSYAWSGYGQYVRGHAGGKRDNSSGIALVNDQAPANGSTPELIISKSQGRAYIANGGRPALVNLRSDDMVLTASETRSALSVPSYAMGTNSDTFGKVAPEVLSVLLGTTPKSAASNNGSGGGSSNVDPTDSWNTLKKLVDYLLDKGGEDLKEQLKVLDDQLTELEAERKAQQQSTELEEKQLAVQNALLDLERAQVERTVRYYNETTQQWEWMADQGAVQSAQEAYDKALQSLNEFLDEQEYNRQADAIKAQKQNLQDQFDAYEDAWKAIIDAIEAPSGDVQALLSLITGSGTSTMQSQAGSIADLLNNLRSGLVAAGYTFGLSNINANTSGSTTNANTVFDGGGFAVGNGFMRKGSAGAETVIGPDITRSILDPVRNERFTSFVDSLRYLVDGQYPSFGSRSSITNNNGGNYYVNGVHVGQDMAQRPFAEVMRTISIHVNETA